MEATPSLACANKCVFCWRHNTNPVGTAWTWALDPPEDIVNQALTYHRALVKEMNGLPGAHPLRLAEAQTPRHCALSLVGEPIMYPHINKLVALLHGEGLSTFLVTNAQFPDKIASLVPVTQLYVSVDAATPADLKRIDRPLFKDYWARLTASLEALRDKGQRSVYRLTLVNSYNMATVHEYARLATLGLPDFIEVKGVTYCGTAATTKPSETEHTEPAPPVLYAILVVVILFYLV
jgi:tRNA wybutosine-synthesizing protein 1